ncbi:hypothetical protein Q7C15_04915 [Aeromonas salmonicida]|uniref:hypothetical protein n=1 Tax=Aeromonas salmonicida TaxID=645 RepID=UPI0035C1ABB9
MDWLPALLKHLSIARSAVVALLVTSAVMYFGQKLAPEYIDELPKEWSTVVVGIFVFSACLVTFWGLAFFWAVILNTGGALSVSLSALRLTNLEQNLLLRLAEQPTEAFNLEGVNYQNAPYTHLELLQTAYGLKRKGLVTINSFHENYVSLSESGRKRALKLQQRM